MYYYKYYNNLNNKSLNNNIFFDKSSYNIFSSIDNEKKHDIFFINRIKFKPGYKRLWRNARSSIKELLLVRYKYQYKLTRYLTKFTKQSLKYLPSFIEISFIKVMLYTKLLPDKQTINLFFKNNYIYLNGSLLTNLNLFLIKNDLIQLIVSKWYYILYRWVINWTYTRLKKFKKLIYKKGLSSKYKLMKTIKERSTYTPNWIYNSEFYLNDIKNYIEVDYFSLSAFLLYEPHLLHNLNTDSYSTQRVNIYKLYNWKYIT